MKTRYVDIDDRTDDLRRLMRKEKERARQFLAKFDCSLIYHENALEGIVFSSQELLAALDPNAVAADASIVPIFTEIRNHRAALDLVREEAGDKRSRITVTLFKKLYEVLGTGIEGREKAVYRRDMPLHRTYFHDISQPANIPAQLEKLVDFTTTAEYREFHPINQAATIHWMLMQAFPFTENSGKVARLVSHLILIRAGYLPAIIHAIDRQRYYESLRLPVGTLRQLLLEAMENSLENAFKYFSQQAAIRVHRASGE
ncbi:MAG: Fic family protein [Deltaproteobacteria bacterium]|nr:Fic family protein [Deltaproteobacteria bacterium]